MFYGQTCSRLIEEDPLGEMPQGALAGANQLLIPVGSSIGIILAVAIVATKNP
jgi:hypothetical protein